MAHDWEKCDHPWEDDGDDDDLRHFDDSSSDEDEGIDWNKVSPEEAGDELAEQLLAMLNRGQLSARGVCTLSFLATKAGAQGPVQKLAFSPAAASGHFQRHLDSVLGYQSEKNLCMS